MTALVFNFIAGIFLMKAIVNGAIIKDFLFWLVIGIAITLLNIYASMTLLVGMLFYFIIFALKGDW